MDLGDLCESVMIPPNLHANTIPIDHHSLRFKSQFEILFVYLFIVSNTKGLWNILSIAKILSS